MLYRPFNLYLAKYLRSDDQPNLLCQVFSQVSYIFIALILFVYDGRAEANQCYSFYSQTSIMLSDDLVRENGDWFEVALPYENEGNIFYVYKKIKLWEEVTTYLDTLPIETRFATKNRLEQIQTKFDDIVLRYQNIAQQYGGILKARIKDYGSLRNKIIEKAKKNSAEQNIDLDSIDDLIGLRLVVPSNSIWLSPLMAIQTKVGKSDDRVKKVTQEFRAFLADQLTIKPEWIDKIDFKGVSQEDIQKKGYYRAIHVTFRPDGQTTTEFQIMSRDISVWHAWDHPKRYKGKFNSEDYGNKMEKYSSFWIQTIRYLEDIEILSLDNTSERAKFDRLRQFLYLNRVPMDLYEGIKIYGRRWIFALDDYIAKSLKIEEEDRFLGERGILTAFQKGRLMKRSNMLFNAKKVSNIK